MNKKKLILTLILSLLSIAVIYFCVSFFEIGLWNYWFVLVAMCVGGLPVVLFFRELERGVKQPLLKLACKWPVIVWVMGVALSVIYVLMALFR